MCEENSTLADLHRAGRHCRRAEERFHAGDAEAAVDHGRRAYALASADPATLNFCAWLFSNSGHHDEAAAAYQRLLARYPDWAAGHRHCSGSLAAAGRLDPAAAHAAAASDLVPQSLDYAMHAGSLLLSLGKHAAAVKMLRRAAALAPAEGAVLRQLSAALWELQRRDEAVAAALQAASLAPDQPDTAVHAAELLLRVGRAGDAAVLARDAAAKHPDHPALWRLLSAAEMQCERPQAALDAVERALRLVPQTAEYHVHRGGVLYRLGRLEAAAESFRCGAELDGGDAGARRSQVSVYLECGRLTDALAAGGELLRAHPEDAEAAETVLHALNQRLNIFDADYVVVRDRLARPTRAPRAEPGLAERARTQARVLHALIIRETRTRFGESRLGYGLALLEPILHILMLSGVFALLMHGRPPLGDHFFLFYLTGLIRYSGANGTGAARLNWKT